MNISPINCQGQVSRATSFKANLFVDKSVQKVIEPNKENFLNAAKKFDGWLRFDKGYVNKTLTVRKNSSLVPGVALERTEERLSYAYPFEESGHPVREQVKKYEDLEFELGGKKCGFWFDPASGVEKLLSDFKNMFNYLHQG